MDVTGHEERDQATAVPAASRERGGAPGAARWLAAMIVGVLIAWLGAVASFGILTFAALFLGAFFAGRVAGARTARQWAVAALLTVGGFTLLWLVARQGTV